MLKSFKVYTCTNGSLGLHLSRAPWDPYPWVSSIQKESTSYRAGLRVGDCLLELNGNDVLGLKISVIANLLKNHWLNESSNHVSVMIWRNKTKDADNSGAEDEDDEDEENNAHNINQQSLQKFATCLQHIAQLLECPVCLEVVKPPGWQCCNGHVLCNNCRSRSEKCPVCRVPLGPRGRCLLSDKLFTLLADSFPCDGVRSNKNSPKERRKCSTDFHNQPKMAIIQKQQHSQLDENDEVKAKDFKKNEQDFISRSLRMGRRRGNKAKKEDTSEADHQANEQEQEQQNKWSHHAMVAQVLYNSRNSIVNVQVQSNAGSRKSSQDYSAPSSVVQVTGPADDAEGETLSRTVTATTNTTTTATTTMMSCDELLAAQCHCRMCYKPDKVAIVNNVREANKYILRVQTEQQQLQQQEYMDNQHHHHHHQHSQQQKYQNYQCPTGKLCCLQQNVLANAMQATKNAAATNTQQQQQHEMTNNKLSTMQTNVDSSQNSCETVVATAEANATTSSTTSTDNANEISPKMLRNEWELLAHLTQDHQLAVNQYYAEYGQRIAISPDVLQKTIICLNLRGSATSLQIEKFFVAFVPLALENQHSQATNAMTTKTSSSSSSSLATTTKVAVFIWHMNTTTSTTASSSAIPRENNDEVSNFDAIIENPKTGIKWFGRAHCLTTPWSHIYHKQHFLMHEVMADKQTVVPGSSNVVGGAGDGPGVVGSSDADAFVIVIKSKSS